MRLVQTLGGIVSVILAVAFGVPAVISGSQLVSRTNASNTSLHSYSFVIGSVEFNDWAVAGVLAAASISFGVLAWVLLFPRDKPHWQSGSGG